MLWYWQRLPLFPSRVEHLYSPEAQFSHLWYLLPFTINTLRFLLELVKDCSFYQCTRQKTKSELHQGVKSGE